MRIDGVTTVERAYQLAQSGTLRTISEIKQRLQLEGFGDAQQQLAARTLTNDLRLVLKAAQLSA